MCYFPLSSAAKPVCRRRLSQESMLPELFDREKLVVGPMLHRAQAYMKDMKGLVELF